MKFIEKHIVFMKNKENTTCYANMNTAEFFLVKFVIFNK